MSDVFNILLNHYLQYIYSELMNYLIAIHIAKGHNNKVLIMIIVVFKICFVNMI